jgi:1,5-anhydro-D-fructose reductase (1,5-anhydro-D-mannitol-forming)
MKSIKGTVRWGIIGCGDVCEVKSGPAFNKVSNSELVAVMRRDAEKAADFARRHSVGKYYTDAADVVKDPDINAIYIATPPYLHEPYALMAMEAGKPVYIEKPVTLNALSCEKLIRGEAQHAARVSVAHYRRALPLFNKVKSLIREGAIGNVRVVRIVTLQPKASKIITQTSDNWRVNPEQSGGGLFHDLSPHQLDIMYWLFGPPAHVTARGINQSDLYPAPDVVTLNAICKNNICVQGMWAFNVAEEATADACEITGDKGLIRFSFFRKSTIELTNSSGTAVIEQDYPVNIQHPMIDGVVRFFRDEGENPCSLTDALVVMKMLDKVDLETKSLA